ncbi:MAG: glycosyltransferase family 2 protein [Desulfobulbaceae bacterium]|nr:glycosyltransferase family 2 protein [Desulfobulbaceae bacterium]
MLREKSIAVVIPAHNEELLIAKVLVTMPEFVDYMVVVDDVSSDETVKIVQQIAENNPKVILLRHNINKGVGAAISTGYIWARDHVVDVTAVMAGDFQMDPEDLERIVLPVCLGTHDYTKGNRLFRGESWEMIPRHRYLGNSFLSLLTKIASGYWHIADSQSGYTAISLQALKAINLETIYPRYGMPNDILIKLNIANFRVKDVSTRPVYKVGEVSGIKLKKVIFTIPWILLKGFWARMFQKYVIRDFHPLVFFYTLGVFFGFATVILFVRIVYFKFISGFFPPTSSLATMFSFISCSQFILFAMWFDMEENKNLK